MKQAGCLQISFGIESGSQKILDILNKRTTPEMISNTLHMVREAGIGSSGTLMLGNPGETLETVRETIEFITSVEIDYIVTWFFTPLPGSQIYKDHRQYGTLNGSYSMQNCMDVTFVPFGLTKEQLECNQKEMYRKFYLRPSRILKELRNVHNLHTMKIIFQAQRSFFAAKTNLTYVRDLRFYKFENG